MTAPTETYLKVEQVAARFGVSVDSIWRWKRNGDVPQAVRLGPGATRWKLTDIEAWEACRERCLATHHPF